MYARHRLVSFSSSGNLGNGTLTQAGLILLHLFLIWKSLFKSLKITVLKSIYKWTRQGFVFLTVDNQGDGTQSCLRQTGFILLELFVCYFQG